MTSITMQKSVLRFNIHLLDYYSFLLSKDHKNDITFQS
jgi:hypothetical protein